MIRYAFLLAAVLLVGMAVHAQGSMRIFADGHLYSGPSSIENGALLLPLQGYVDAARLHMHQQGGCYCVYDANDKSCPIAAASGDGLYANGQRVEGALTMMDGTPWVNAEVLTKSLGGRYRFDTSVDTVDIVVHQRTAAAAPVAAPPGAYALGPDAIDILVSCEHADVTLHLGESQVKLFDLSSALTMLFDVEADGGLAAKSFKVVPEVGGLQPGSKTAVLLNLVGPVSAGVWNGSIIVRRHNDGSTKLMRVPVTLRIVN